MNIRQIEAFRLVILRGSMTAAAEELETSQPSISRLISELESSSGLTLFKRNGGRIQPTEAGVAFYREVERSFIGLDKLSQSAREILELGSGRLRIVAAPVLALSFLPAILERFITAHPRVAISFEMQSETTLQHWVSSGHCDVAFATAPSDAFGVTSADLYRLAGFCAMPVGHPLAARKRIRASDLKGERLILPTYYDETRPALDRALQDAGAKQVPAVETPYGSTICALVSRGVGIGVVNPLTAIDADNRRIAFRPFSPNIMFSGYALYSEIGRGSPLVALLLEMVNESMNHELAKLEALT